MSPDRVPCVCYLRRVRVEVRRVTSYDAWGQFSIYRVCEVDGPPVTCWLPGLETPDPLGALDRGGFQERHDARAFALGVEWERCHFGLIPGMSTEDVDRERWKLDGVYREAPSEPHTGPPLFGWTAA